MSNAAGHDETAGLSARQGWWFRIRRFFNKSKPPGKDLGKACERPPPAQRNQIPTDNGHPSKGPTLTGVPDHPDRKKPTPQSSLPEEFQAALNQRIEGGRLELPLLPDVVMEVMNLSTSDDADPHKLTDILHRDQTLDVHFVNPVPVDSGLDKV